MAPNNAFLILFGQLVMAAPMLLVYVVGLIVAARFARRAPRPATLAIFGLALMLLTTLGASTAQTWFLTHPGPGGIASIATRMQVSGVAFTLLRAVGMGLVVAAVFSGRRATDGFEVGSATPAAPPLARLAPNPQPAAE